MEEREERTRQEMRVEKEERWWVAERGVVLVMELEDEGGLTGFVRDLHP